MSETTKTFDARGAFVVGCRARGWAEPGALRRALASVDLEGLAPNPVTPREALGEAMAAAFPGPHTVQALPKGGGLVVLRFVPSHDGRLKEGMPVFAANVDKAGVVDVIHDPDDDELHEDRVLALYEGYRHLVSPGRLVFTIRSYANSGLSGASIDAVTWLPPRSLDKWGVFVSAFTSVAPVRVSTVRCAVDEETAKAVIDHVTAARLKEAEALGEKLVALDPLRELAQAEIRGLTRRARQLEALVAKDEADLGVTLDAVRNVLAKAMVTKSIADVQEAIAGSGG